MNVLARWGKFNLVGAIGMGVQLGALAVLDRLAPAHYLLTSAAALEIALLHNFVWHLNYTWRDRRDTNSLPAQCLRFHISNGLVSLAGNLALMRLLVGAAHLPVLAANGIAILFCSTANFLLGHKWAFATGNGAASEDPLASRFPGSKIGSPGRPTAMLSLLPSAVGLRLPRDR